jgi:NADH-quinone oxidoreductase subunit L
MSSAIQIVWLIPVLPLVAAACIALMKQPARKPAAALAIGAMGLAFILSLAAFFSTLGATGEAARQVYNFTWFSFGETSLRLGWILDPLTAVMLVMVTFVGSLIFIYSVGYMAHDQNFTRFFCFLSLFAAAMLGLVIANNLLLFFICWELVGLASYLLIGFWYHKPSAAAAAKKAFVTTRIGDIGFLLGMLWLYSQSGTLLFYDGGNGCLETSALSSLVAHTTVIGMAASTGIALLIFCGAMGKSGQVPLHVWLPDAMEGPTPVSALIHAATMVAAGVFLIARVFPLLAAHPEGAAATTTALQVVTWVGAITALFAALVAVAQNDIKRILAYSTVSQLGFMFMGLGMGGVAVGMFHLITHAFFKALLFMGAGSVIHGCHDEQDIRRMGGLKKWMPTTFATYAVGMMALAGVPLFFSGFWSKDEILHAAHGWPASHGPFYIGVAGAILTAFYMTRQMAHVFFGKNRSMGPAAATARPVGRSERQTTAHSATHSPALSAAHPPHESPPVMTWPLIILAVFAVLLGFVGTPAWPWFQGYLTGTAIEVNFGRLFSADFLGIVLISTLAVGAGIGTGWWLYGRKPLQSADQPDVLERAAPDPFALLRNKFFFDELYEATVIRFTRWWALVSDWLDRNIWNGAVQAVSYLTLGFAWLNRFIDEYVLNLGFDASCRQVARGGRVAASLQTGRIQNYLRVIGLALTVLMLLLIWGCRS